MKKNFFLTAAALVLSMGMQAQIQDVTSTYIQNPGFESCEAVPVVTPEEGDPYVELIGTYTAAAGTDYADQGWTLQGQYTYLNSGVITYGVGIKINNYQTIPSPAAGPAGTTGNKGLVFVGNNYSNQYLIYQTPEVTLPAGWYRMTVNVCPVSTWGETTSIANQCGFVATNGTKYCHEGSIEYKVNAWNNDELEILLPEETKGVFQLCVQGQCVILDDVKIEYEARVITTALEEAIVKAKAISTKLGDSDPELTAAIQAAENFIANPTTQNDVQNHVTLLMSAVNTALLSTFEPIDITEAFVANNSFETGKNDPWQVTDGFSLVTPSPWQAVKPNIDGAYYGYFTNTATNCNVQQSLSGLPAGFYYAQAIIEGKNPVTIFLGTTEGTASPLWDTDFSVIQTPVVELTDGAVTIGAKGDPFNIDNFRLVYCTDEDALQEFAYNSVVEAARAVLNDEGFAIITGEERTAFEAAINATEGSYADLTAAINEKMLAFTASKADYQTFETAKTNAAAYTLETYPYADPAIYEEIQKLCATVATSASDAVRLSQELTYTCQTLVDSHFRLDGVTGKVSYTADLLEATWTLDGIEADTESGEGYYKHTQELYESNPAEGSMEVTLTNMPAGKYAFVCDERAGYYVIPTLSVNGAELAVLPHSNMEVWQNGGYVPNWKKDIYSFDMIEGGDLTLKVALSFNTNYPNYYHAEFGIGNMMLFKIGEVTEFTEQVDVERIVGQGYTAQAVTVDLAKAKSFLGVDELTTSMLRIINPDGSQISDYAGYDGWFNKEGTAEYWGNNAFCNVKFFQAIPNGEYTICDMNNPAVGDKFSCKWALTANDKTYIFQTNVTWVEAPPVELTVVDLGIVASVEYDSNEASYVEKTVSLTDEQVSAILGELGLTALNEATVAGYNPTTKELVSNYAGFDGWRDANGDFQNWTGNSTVPACVKYSDGKTYYCYNIAGCEPQTIKTYWAICNDTKAVLVEIDFIYTSVVDGIGTISLSNTKAPVYNLNGQRMNGTRKGLNIVDGKKVMVK